MSVGSGIGSPDQAPPDEGQVGERHGLGEDRVVDRTWDPPVTLGVRLVSILDDDTQHAGQAAYVRGLLS